jgi:sulfate transport system ATP-binding protein
LGQGAIIEAQLAAAQFRQEGFAEGDILVLTPKKARVFVEG